MDLVSGLSKGTSEPSRRLAELGTTAAQSPVLAEALRRGTTLDALDAIEPEFAGAVRAYLKDYGCRVFHHAIDYPALGEKPEIVLGLLRDHLQKGYDERSINAGLENRRAATVSQAPAALAGRSAAEREYFERALVSARITYPVKEGCEYATFEVPMSLVRYALIELGSRLTRRNRMEQPDDVFFLEMDEAIEAFQAGKDVLEPVVDAPRGVVLLRRP